MLTIPSPLSDVQRTPSVRIPTVVRLQLQLYGTCTSMHVPMTMPMTRTRRRRLDSRLS